MYQKALEGVRVADFTWVVAGPFCTRLLALMGAEVIKIESATRAQYKNRGGGSFGLNDSKKSCTINLSSEKGKSIARELVANSDVVVENFSTGVMDRLGLGYDAVKEIRKDIIYVSSSGVGRTGPAKDYPAYGSLLQGFSGWTSLFGEPNPRMEAMGVDPSWTDPLTGSWEAFIIQAALFHRARTGEGVHVDLSMLESAIVMMGDVFLAATATLGGAAGDPSPDYAHAAPHGIYPCKRPDSWIAISIETQAEWEGFRTALGNPAWCREAGMLTPADRQRNRSQVDHRVAEWTSRFPVEELFHLLQKAGVRAGPCADFRQVMTDPQMVLRGLFQPISMSNGDKAMTTGLPWSDDSGWKGVLFRAPDLGEHNEYVFKELLHMSDAEYEDHRAAGVIQ
jgi:benzylsuccinate CoA-transferase BbsF subunit